MRLSILIPAFNEENLIGQTMARIQQALWENQVEKASWELIVCDNNSTDKTAEIAAQAGATVVFEPVNHISRARNTAARATKGEWFLFIDADSFPTPALMAEVLALMEGDTIVGCGTTVTVEDGTLFNKLRMERLNPLFRLFNWCGGAFLLCRREAFEAIGGFTTDLYALEEIDFVVRLKRYGRKRGQRFTILYRHPVITSGRKGEYDWRAWIRLVASNVIAIFLLLLYYLLPPKLRPKASAKLLGYWYNTRQ